ncbi:myb-like protein X [Onthophagus taurus]|uniref:myb-like protein X n=1 Tax=Onthophagus taurus TaxID=166361 RepID=UPI000C2081EA|nr:putative leucine-rich repeat-containing protein DDB_G0290503 [Onthophagus taurus]
MTSSRIVRGTKTRVLLYIVAAVVLTGFIACFNSTRIELDKATKSNELCQREQENLATQLQVISDYKQGLEKSLKNEKTEHQQTKLELERRVDEEKKRTAKNAGEATKRFDSLQQQYNILKTGHDDLQEKCAKAQNDQSEQINNLKARESEFKERIKKIEKDKENALEHLKSQIEHLQNDKINLENQLKSDPSKEELLRLQKELEKYKGKSLKTSENFVPPNHSENKTSFKKQIPLDSNDYKITNEESRQIDTNNNVADLPNLLSNDNDTNNVNKDNIDTQNFLQKPGSSNAKTSTPANLKGSKEFNLAAAPLKMPTVTPESVNKNKTTETVRKLPDGVPPQPFAQPVHQESVLKSPSDSVIDLINNRYRNVAEVEKNKIDERNEIEKENGANEVLDFPEDNEVGDGKEGKHVGDNNKDRVYEEYDKFPQNDDNLQENEEDDDVDEYANRHPEREAQRN